MKDLPNRRTTRPRVTKVPSASTEAAEVTEARQSRGARRKRETRARLLDATLRLVADKGMDCVTINDITEIADVGSGSFYNHFESKEAIFAAVFEWVFDEFADALDHLASGLSDPAEVIAVSVRHTLMRARREPVWGQLLIREGFSARILNWGLGPRLLRDGKRGIAAGRFVVADPFLCLISATGIILAGIAVELHFATSIVAATRGQTEPDWGGEKFAERTAAYVLQALGLNGEEAEKIAGLPLPMGNSEVKTG
ncbi:TetR/AcrR family transcriptional regulator [Trinickia mobilis]|uniref:TetR/AcrR family transcriptional regulator n=1 Tax=Trinickia mobilis TaxID=2816356 RepID=UPI001A8E6E84|nr:TetR/AcrR family transcriptional regulator [Trinickia mobilis]